MLVNKEAMRAWVDALRSGEFQQGQKRLYNADEDSYCCLGVLCVVAKREGAIEHLPWEHPDITQYQVSVLNREVSEWVFGSLGKDSFADDIVIAQAEPITRITAVRANDALGWGFRRIADEIEKMFLRDGESTDAE